MKICYLADARSGHTKRWVEYFAKDNEVDLITFDYATKDGAFITEKDYIKMGVRVHKIPRKIPNLLLTPVIVRRLIHKIAPDVLHAHYATQYGFCGAFSGFHPFILSIWGSDVLIDPDKSVILKLMVKTALKNADLVHAGSKIFVELASKKYAIEPEKTMWTYYGVLDDFISSECHSSDLPRGVDDHNSIHIISIRGFDPIYSIETLIAAIPKVRERYSHICFTVIGEGPEPEEKKIKDLAAALKIDNVVQFREFVPHDELPSVLKHSDIYVDTLPVSAGVSVGLLEAMASGCFPIVARIPGVSEVITDGKNGLIYEGKNSDHLAEKICLAIENTNLRKNARKTNIELILERGLYNKNMSRINEKYLELASSDKTS